MTIAGIDPEPLQLQLISPTLGSGLDISQALVARPTVTRTMAGVSTFDLSVTDADRHILRARELSHRLWAIVANLHWELVRISKSGDRLSLTFEDAVVAELRRQTSRLTIAAGSTTRAGIAAMLAGEIDVPYAAQPTTARVVTAIERSTSGQESNSWEVLGSDVADPVRWRRFSDGRRLIVGGDDWLLRRSPAIHLTEHTGPVGAVNFDLDQGRRAETATVDVDLEAFAIDPGIPAVCFDYGPARGTWLVEEVRQELGASRGTVKLTRGRRALPEPTRPAGGSGDAGVTGFVPRATTTTKSAGTAGSSANAARERMVQYALKQKGKRYVWGASGPNSFDCSGLVQEATRHAGRVLAKPSASQWTTVKRRGRVISVKEAYRTRGALLFRVGLGGTNHIAISLGDGSTIEAMGSAYGVVVARGAASRRWTGAGIWI
ncbi:C40 family peptidase [Nocardioides sp. CPCC 205120]|uniref:C40 family peptidase n=1 Tax=Nocardioides sp. CPCC 205120 TaxID=3406462 RepID=UPI003B50532D